MLATNPAGLLPTTVNLKDKDVPVGCRISTLARGPGNGTSLLLFSVRLPDSNHSPLTMALTKRKHAWAFRASCSSRCDGLGKLEAFGFMCGISGD